MTQWLLIHEDKRMERLRKTKRYKKMMAFKKAIPWEELFRATTDSLWDKERKGPQGRPHYDSIKMFQILILQSLYNFSDEKMEEELITNLLFQDFLDIGADDSVPDCNTISDFRDALQKRDLLEKLFKCFDDYLNSHGYKIEGGQIVDATFVEVPRQRNTREENEYTKENGKLPDEWSKNKKSHKDSDASWTKKNNKDHYGFKNHVNVDAKHKFIRKFKVTTASVHDSQACPDIIQHDKSGGAFYADSAYHSSAITAKLEKEGLESKVCSKGCRYKKLTDEEKKQNREFSRTRCRVEHVFAWFNQSTYGNRVIHVIGQAHVTAKVTLMNLTYNLSRFFYLSTGKLCLE